MVEDNDPMEKFEFLIGTWELLYNIPKSIYSEATTGSGTGTFKRALDGKYVYFDYSCTIVSAPEQIGKAHAIFAWDANAKIYRYWWFENSGSFLTATCNFINEDTLFLNWHDTLLIQSFKRINPGKIFLSMEHPNAEGKYVPVLEVTLMKK